MFPRSTRTRLPSRFRRRGPCTRASSRRSPSGAVWHSRTARRRPSRSHPAQTASSTTPGCRSSPRSPSSPKTSCAASSTSSQGLRSTTSKPSLQPWDGFPSRTNRAPCWAIHSSALRRLPAPAWPASWRGLTMQAWMGRRRRRSGRSTRLRCGIGRRRRRRQRRQRRQI